MTVQIIGIVHRDSNIKQALFFSWDRNPARSVVFQSVAFGKTSQRSLTLDEAHDTLRAWRDLLQEGELTVTHIDSLTLKTLFGGAESLEMVTGIAPTQTEEA